MKAVKYLILGILGLLTLACLVAIYLGLRYYAWAPELLVIGSAGLIVLLPALLTVKNMNRK